MISGKVRRSKKANRYRTLTYEKHTTVEIEKGTMTLFYVLFYPDFSFKRNVLSIIHATFSCDRKIVDLILSLMYYSPNVTHGKTYI